MQKKDLHKPLGGLNTDDNPAVMPPGDYPDALNMRISSSDEQHGVGPAETLQGEIELLIGVTGEVNYYGEAIGGNFIYSGYPEIQIGNQIWMKRNWDYNYPGSKAYNDALSNISVYGRLYTHAMVMSVGFCPDGWRMPTEADIDELLTYLGGQMIAGGPMKEVGTDLWTTPNTGANNISGFTALPGGKFDLLFELLGLSGSFWLEDESVPNAPVAIDATDVEATSFTANWETVEGADGYYLDVATDNLFTMFVAGYNNKNVHNVLTYNITGLVAGTQYYYRVRAFNDVGSSASSNTMSLPTAINAPTNLVATVISKTRIDLVWDDNSFGEDGIKVERSTDEINYVPLITLPADTEAYSDITCVEGVTYFYRVYAYIGAINSYYSNIASGTTILEEPTGLTATPVTDTRIDLAWTDNSAHETAYLIERGTDGIVFVQIASIAAGSVSHQDNTCSPNTRYYYRVRASNTGNYSAYSNTDDDWTPMNIPLISTGTGTGVSTIRFQVDVTDVVMTIDGNGMFYDNAGATIGAATSKTLIAGALRVFYLKVTSGTCKILVFHKNNLSYWGNNAALYGWFSSTNAARINGMTLSAFAHSLQYINVIGLNTISGNVTDLWSGLIYYYISSTNTVTGNIANFPATVTGINLSGSCTIGGHLIDLPASVVGLSMYGTSVSVHGDIGDLKEGFTSLIAQTGGLMTGSLASLPSTMTLLLAANNSITGDLSDLPVGMTLLNLDAGHNITGDIADLPAGMTYIQLASTNTVYGDIVDLPAGITHVEISGSNTITGDIADIPATCTYFSVEGLNTIFGILADIVANLTTFGVTGSNTISGDIADIPANVTNFTCLGSNTITGDVANIPAAILNIYIHGANTISGNIADVPGTVKFFAIQGLNTVTGDLADLPTSIYYYMLQGLNTVSTYTYPATLGFTARCVHLPALGSGLASDEVDNLLIDLSGHGWSSTGYIDLRGNNAARTAASNAAKATLEGMGVEVYTN
jgi:uncharacterized protein (TIGR02145 family)